MLDKLKFWKKDDFSSFSDEPSLSDDPMTRQHDPLQQSDPYTSTTPTIPGQGDFGSYDQGSSFSPTTQPGMMGTPHDDMGTSPFTQPDVQGHQDYPDGRDRDMELVLAKLDAIKSELDSLHQRVRKIEQTSNKKTVW